MRHISLVLLIFLGACVPESKQLLTEVKLQAKDPVFQQITTFQHRSQLDSLAGYLASEDPNQRYLAARALASHNSPQLLDSLNGLLNDPLVKLRALAAYAIGQQGNPASVSDLIAGYRQRDTMSVNNAGNAAILEAIGKIGTVKEGQNLALAKGYRDTDTLLIEGQMKCFFQLSNRGITAPEMTTKALATLRNPVFSKQARLYAAHYFARARQLDISAIKFQLAEAMVKEDDPNIKMALVTALKHTDDEEIKSVLKEQLNLRQDYRVTCNLIRTMTSYDPAGMDSIMIAALRSDNQHIAMAASEYIGQKANPNTVSVFRNVAKDSIPWTLRSQLLGSVLKVLPYYYTKTKNATRWQLTQALSKEENIHGQAAYLRALGNDPENYNYIMDYINASEEPVVKTAGMDALGSILAHKDFNFVYQGVGRSNRKRILNYFQEQLLEGDEGVVGSIGNTIANPMAELTELIDSIQFLKVAKERLELPGMIESVHAIEKAIAAYRGITPVLTQAQQFKNINWAVLDKYADNIDAIVKTTKGSFAIQLKPLDAPISVINFIELSASNYFDDKIFHRVVPNFVVQTGSPRGDNYGGAGELITSELGPLQYDDEGYVGMASAGPHTESTQWFVTHSPTPHLDGKYTIFGKVTSGMEIVHQLQVGDRILDVIISDL